MQLALSLLGKEIIVPAVHSVLLLKDVCEMNLLLAEWQLRNGYWSATGAACKVSQFVCLVCPILFEPVRIEGVHRRLKRVHNEPPEREISKFSSTMVKDVQYNQAVLYHE